MCSLVAVFLYSVWFIILYPLNFWSVYMYWRQNNESKMGGDSEESCEGCDNILWYVTPFPVQVTLLCHCQS